MNDELIKSIIDFIDKSKFDCHYIEDSNADILIEELSNAFRFDLSNRYLWENLFIKERYEYKNDGDKYWNILSALLFHNFAEEVFLVVTDDNFFPWPIFYCKRVTIIDILKEHQYFEFFVFDRSMTCVLFDTHENELLLTDRPI